MPDRLPSPAMCYMSQAQTLLHCTDMRLNTHPSSACGRLSACVCLPAWCMYMCVRACVYGAPGRARKKASKEVSISVAPRDDWRWPSGGSDEVGGCGIILVFGAN